MAGQSPQVTFVDPATVALHEIAEPARLRALIKEMRTRHVQDSPVLLTNEPGGHLVLDGVHRTNALISLGIPRMLCVVVPRSEVGEPGGWTHRIDLLGETEQILRRIHASPGLAVTNDLAPGPGVIAQVVTTEQAISVVATRAGRAGLADGYHALARSYATLPYQREIAPRAPSGSELQIRWVAPRLGDVEHLVAEHGALPAGVTRFDLPAGARSPIGAISFDDLRAASDPAVAQRLLASLRD